MLGYFTISTHTHITVFIREHEGKAHLHYDKKGVEIADDNWGILLIME